MSARKTTVIDPSQIGTGASLVWRALSIVTAYLLCWSGFLFGPGCGQAVFAMSPPNSPPPSPEYPIIDGIRYTSAAAAQAQWRSLSGSAAAQLVQLGNRHVLKLTCNLKGTKLDRASWDRSVKLDLTNRAGIQFRAFCSNIDPISHFTCYLQSGKGWYAKEFSFKTRGWNTIQIPKTQTKIEGSPAGWNQISTIRISAWRGSDEDTDVYLADLGVYGEPSSIAVIRCESIAERSPGESNAAFQYLQTAADFLDNLGLGYNVVSDRDIATGVLTRKKVVILPYNPSMPTDMVDRLQQFLREGGKLIACYTLPGKLREAVGIGSGQFVRQQAPGDFASIRNSDEPLKGAPAATAQMSWNLHEATAIPGRSRVAAWWYDENGRRTNHTAIVVSKQCVYFSHVLLTDDPLNKQQLLLAMLGELDARYWATSAKASISAIGRIGRFTDAKQMASEIQRLAGRNPQVTLLLDESRELQAKAIRQLASSDDVGAIGASKGARARLLDAYCLAQRPSPGEFRAVWCHSAFGVEGMTWDEAIRHLADNGFTAILPNMLWGGTAYYRSRVLPVAPEVTTRGDQIEQCVAACKKYGVECHVWKVNWNTGGRASRDFLASMKHEHRTQVDFDGRALDTWLCPSHPDNQQLEIDAMLEIARRYDIDGLHFDYIRYPGRHSCFCNGCRRRFQEWSGETIRDWPRDLRNDTVLQTKWNDFRRNNITKVVEAVSREARKLKPTIKISAAVFRNWPVDRDGVGQDWKLWCERDLLDFVCPMDYTPNNLQFESYVRRQKEWAGDVPCYPGIGLSTWPKSNDIATLIDQIQIARDLQTGGFTIFQYDASTAGDALRRCGMGISRRR